MITLAPRIPPINYSLATGIAWRIVDNQVIVEGTAINRTMSLNSILQVPIEMFTPQTTLPEAKQFLYALIAQGMLEQSEVDAIYAVFPL